MAASSMTRWEFLKKHWVMSLIGFVILLVAIVTVTWAVLTREGDVSFMKGKKGKDLVWGSSPVCIYDPDEVHVDHLAVMDAVRQDINLKVGKMILPPCDPWMLKDPFPKQQLRGNIIIHVTSKLEEEKDGVTVSDPFTPKTGGVTYLYEDDDGKLMAVVMKIHTDMAKDKKVWLHEFGHALGLAHDRRKDSIMYPQLQDRGNDLSSTDLKNLRKAYAK